MTPELASSVPTVARPIQENLQIWIFAEKQGMTIEQVEELLDEV